MGATYTRQSSYTDGDVITAAHTNDEFDQLLAAFQASSGHTHDGTANEGGPITKLLGNTLTFGAGTAGTDITITFDGETSDGVLKWMEDEDYFEFSDDILVASTEKLQFRDTAIYINSSTDGQLDLVADTEIQLVATTVDLNGNLDVSGSITLGGTAITSTAAELNILDGVTSTAAELNILDGVTSTATELNVMDGDTSATSTTVADADRVVFNDAGTMKQVAVTDLAAYFDDEITAMPNLVTVSTLDSGAISSGFGNIDIGSSNLTATGTISLGATSFNDNNITNVGSIQLDSIAGDADTNTSITFSGSDVITMATGGTTALTVDASQNVTVAGDLTVSGDDITMGTNTAGNLLIADGTNFNSVAVGSLSEISTVANDDVFLAVDTSGGGLKKVTRSTIVSGLAVGGVALSNIVEDTTPQLGGNLDTNSHNILIDDAHFIADENGNEQIIFQTTASAVNQIDVTNAATGNAPEISATGGDTNISLKLTPKGSGQVLLDGNVGVESGTIDLKNSGSRSKINFYCESGNAHAQALQAAPHSESASNTLTLPSTGGDVDLVSTASTATLTNKTFGDNVSFGDNNITNVGDIALDSISADGTDINVAVSDNSATAFTIKQGSDNYLVIDTGNSSESIAIGTGISGTAITLGHSTSEVTVADNLTVTGDLTVSGTTTTVNSTTVNLNDHNIVLDSGNSTSAVINGAGITIEGGSGDDATFSYNTTGPKFELKLGSSHEDLQVDQLIASSLDISGNVDVDGTLEADAITVNGTALNTVIAGVTVANATTAAVATTVTISDNESTDEDNAIIFTSGGDVDGGNIGLESDGDLTYNPSTGRLTATQLAGTLQTAAQANVTSLGTLTTLTVDNVIINGSTIGHTGDTDLITVASGVMTVAGEVDATSLDISGDADIDGTLEADAITVNGTALNTVIADEATALAIALG